MRLSSLGIMACFGILISLQPVRAEWTLSTLFDHWPTMPERQAFTEKRFDSLLDLTSNYRGEFIHQNLHGFQIHYLEPIQGTVSMDDEWLRLDFPDRQLQMSLSQAPELAALIQPLKWLIAGNFQPLKTHYDMSFREEGEGKWQLRLTPMQAFTFDGSEVLVRGGRVHDRVWIEGIRLQLKQGDWRQFVMSGPS